MHESHGTVLNVFLNLLPEGARAYVDALVLNSWLVIVLLAVLGWLGTRRRLRIPRGLQTVWEIFYTFVRDFALAEIGPSAEKYVPLLATLFVYILTLNLLGLVPGLLTPTMSLNTTVPLALVAFFAVQYFGFRELGVGYLMHFVGDPWWLFPINIPVHLIGEIAKPLSLSVRLFGNMFGEETAIGRMAALGAAVFAVTYIPVPVQFINVILHMIIGPIQAFIFFMLTAAYLSTATSHGVAEAHRETDGGQLAGEAA